MQKMQQSGSYKSQADAIAKTHGGYCLSQEIQSCTSFALWKCGVKEHPAWSAQFQLVRGFPSRPGTWCRICGREKLHHSIEYVRQALLQRAIRLLSTGFSGVEKPIKCECLKCGYVWTTKYRHIKRGHGCRECKKWKIADKRRHAYEYVRDFCKGQGISLLSKIYNNDSTHIECRCDFCGHIWQPCFSSIKIGCGCPICKRKKAGEKLQYSFDFIFQYLDDHGIDMLSTEYSGYRTKLHVRFRACGHDDYMSLLQIKRGNRCAKCVDNARVTREEYEKLGCARGGRLIVMARAVTMPSTWLCNRGHQFNRSYSDLLRAQTFCTECSKRLGERQCKAAAEQLFRVPFSGKRLKEIRGIGGLPLQLDIYSDSLKLAIEHNGRQHYEPQNNWGGEFAFSRQTEHDRRRRECCKKTGITLIEIRELNDVTHISELKTIIKEACLKGGVPLPPDYDEIKLDLKPACVRTVEEEMWEKVIKQAKRMNYTIVSTGYPGIHGKLHLICENRHLYKPTTMSFLNGHFCRRCWLNKTRVPVVVFPLTVKSAGQTDVNGLIFNSIEEAARTIKVNPNHVRMAAKGRALTCKGYGVVEIACEQAAIFKEAHEKLREFCERQWPNSATFDRYAKARLRLSKPVILSDGRQFNSASDAARNLGVGKSAILRAIRAKGKCCGYTVRQIAK